MTLSLQVVAEPSLDIRNAIDARLREHNLAQPAPADFRSLAVTLTDDAGEVVGGGWGRASWGTFYLVTLVVPEASRGSGLGRCLLDRIEAEARAVGCRQIWLYTHAFQAPGFYLKAGYEQFGELPDPQPAHRRHFLRKALV